MIEALACGTPVIAYRSGSVPEVLDDGVKGFVVPDLDGAVRAVGRVAGLHRAECRRAFEKRFTATRMARDYLKVYRRVLERSDGRLSPKSVVRNPSAGVRGPYPHALTSDF